MTDAFSCRLSLGVVHCRQFTFLPCTQAEAEAKVGNTPSRQLVREGVFTPQLIPASSSLAYQIERMSPY